MILVVDTSVFIDHLRGDERASRTLLAAEANRDELWSAVVVRTELLAGMRKGEESSTRALLDAIRWQDVTVAVADRAGQLAGRYLRSHRGVDTVDYLIAATTQLLGGRLLTQNVKHFPMFRRLRSPY